jgi:hypothetical protein
MRRVHACLAWACDYFRHFHHAKQEASLGLLYTRTILFSGYLSIELPFFNEEPGGLEVKKGHVKLGQGKMARAKKALEKGQERTPDAATTASRSKGKKKKKKK